MLGILCGLESEAKIARRITGAIVACAAARPHKARDLARELVGQGATRLMSFGIAGSLSPAVGLGDLVIGTHIVSAKGEWNCDAAWAQELLNKIPHAKRGGVYGSETLVATGAEKQALGKTHDGAIVDMESQCMAEIAAEYHLPMIVVRSVCDDANMNVPPVVMAAIAEDGSVDVIRAITHLAKHPMQFGDLFHVMRGTGRALGALKSVCDKI